MRTTHLTNRHHYSDICAVAVLKPLSSNLWTTADGTSGQLGTAKERPGYDVRGPSVLILHAMLLASLISGNGQSNGSQIFHKSHIITHPHSFSGMYNAERRPKFAVNSCTTASIFKIMLVKKRNLSSKNTELPRFTVTWRVQTRHLHLKNKLAHLNNSCRPTLCTKYPVLTALLMMIQVFCDVTPSRLVNNYRRLEVTCLHPQNEVAQGQSTRRHIAGDFNYLQVSIRCIIRAIILYLCLLNIILCCIN
jgi:hypothetical protein